MSPGETTIGCARRKVASPFAGSGFGSVSLSNPTMLYEEDPVLGLRTTSVTGADDVSPVVLMLQESISPAF